MYSLSRSCIARRVQQTLLGQKDSGTGHSASRVRLGGVGSAHLHTIATTAAESDPCTAVGPSSAAS